MTCLVIGDSIAQGVAQAAPICQHLAIKDISTVAFESRYADQIKPADVVVISLGANDDPNDDDASRQALARIRKRVGATYVIWLAPANSEIAADTVRETGWTGDHVISLKGLGLAPDHVHPTGQTYRMLAWMVMQADRKW